ncbi:TonB-dependent receptor domain-containing protein [Thauera linaloolentis]|uniref:Receptor protein n=1 Tax=Thauera linaloolentis (strain DSM 12138 / JCM 21573 / CCUG 41526 / CIP 105981 / IAM 15112 / NBRC 102519 / 47Lol) TaxID=1123367 RepID=N6Z6S9_THAL4|nr:TonB-dependent receptor [Thauera linaloolentis]ENO90257.1 receptor protein [Thauera linaloolentis 47Lol = DSM 12138]MCM8566253.1 TonB-dependent receptor [Thauera linaloolentis]
MCIGLALLQGAVAYANQGTAVVEASGEGKLGEEAQGGHPDDATVMKSVTVIGQHEKRDEQGRNDVFDKDVVNVYQGKEEIERYKGSAAADVFKGMNGVYSGDARNSGALDPNIRGIQGEGRIPVIVDGTEQATSVWMGPAGVSNRNYVDPNMIGGITVEKGPSLTSPVSGIGGSVQVRTLEPDDIVKPGERFGIEFKAETSTNSVKPNESTFGYFGRDYRDIPGAANNMSFTNGLILPGRSQIPKEGNGGRSFSFDDKAFRLAIATKQEHFDLLMAHSDRKRGNYFSGKKGSSKYETDSWREDAERDANVGSVSGVPSVSYIARYYQPGDEVKNTSSDQQSTLLKGTLRLPHDQTLKLGFMRTKHEFGESIPWMIIRAIVDSDGSKQRNMDVPYSEIRQDNFNIGYTWQPADNPWVDLEAGLWMTQNDSRRHQNGNDAFGIGDFDQAWDRYTHCHVLHTPHQNCVGVSSTPPEKLPNDDGRFNVQASALQISDHRRTGFNLSNRMRLHPTLDLAIHGDYTREKLRQRDASENQVLTELTWGVNHMGPRSGTRQQWNAGFNFDWRPVGWLQVNAGMRYSDYWSFDDKLAEKRRNKSDVSWAVQPEITAMEYRYQRIMSDDEVAAQKEYLYGNYGRQLARIQQFFPGQLEAFLGEYPDAETFANSSYRYVVDGYWYSSESETISVPYSGNHKGFAEINPFMNGIFDPNEQVENAQGKAGSAKRYVMGGRNIVYGPEPAIEKKWALPKRVKDHAWVPHLGMTVFITNNIRLYARYSEFVRFPSVFESSMALAGGNKRSTGVAGRPEHAYNWEVGYVHNLSGYFENIEYVDFRLNYFNNRIEDYIDRDWSFNIVQFAEKKLSGIEVQARADSGKYFANFGATYRLKQELCDKDYASYLDPIGGRISACIDGGFPRTFARTALQPKYSVNLDLGARLLERKLQFGTRAVYHSEASNEDEAQFGQIGWGLNRANYWNPILVFDAYASYRLDKNIDLDVAVTNLTNRYYLDPMARVSQPAPGRTIRVGMTARF